MAVMTLAGAVETMDSYLSLARYRSGYFDTHEKREIDTALAIVRRNQLAQIERLVRDALETDGAHHKQFFLAKIAELVGIPAGDDLGVAP